MKRLRETPPPSSLTFLYEIHDTFKVVFLNANSLHRHLIDVRADFSLQCADVLGFSESRFVTTDTSEQTEISGFQSYRQDSETSKSSTRPFYGLAVYFKPHLHDLPRNCNTSSSEIVHMQLNSPLPALHLVYIYKPPKVPVRNFLQDLSQFHSKHLHTKTAIVMGDFNVNWRGDSSAKRHVDNFFSEHGFHQLISGPTTDDDTTIDLLFANCNVNLMAGTLEAYYSPHKAIWAGIPYQ